MPAATKRRSYSRHAFGLHLEAPSASFLKLVLTMKGCTRYSGSSTTVRTVVDDPLYLVQSFMVSTNFKQEAEGASKWSPKGCRE